MKKYIPLAISCWIVGLTLVVVQSLIEPATMKSATATLQHCTPNSGPRIIFFSCLFFLTNVGYCVLTALSMIIKEKLVAFSVSDWTLSLMRKVLFTQSGFLAQNEPEKIVRRISRDTETLTSYRISALVELPLTLSGFLITLYTMYFGSFQFLVNMGCDAQKGNVLLASTLLCLTPLHLLFLLYNKKMMAIEQMQADSSEKEALVSTEALRAITDVRASNAFCFVLKRITAAILPTRTTRIRLFSISTIFQSISGLVWGGTQVIVLGIAAWLIFKVDTGFEYSDYIGFSSLCATLNMSVVKIVDIAINWQKSRQAAERLREIEQLPDVFGPGVGRLPNAQTSSLSFRNLSYELSPDIKILSDINLTIQIGEHVALVGPSGCGKSTLLKMAMRHLAPTTGDTIFAGTPIQDLDFAYYAKHVAYVSQKPFIFQGSIRDNILVGRELNLSNTELTNILQDVALYDDLLKKDPDIEKALEIQVGADGAGLSGGQMAKIALARALVGHPDVLLLDEVTAPLDELSQDKVTTMLDQKLRKKTIISISHRLPTVRNMDRIIVMESGHCVQEGTYDDLASQPGLFATLVARETGIAPTITKSEPKLNFGDTQRDAIQTISLSPIFSELDSIALEAIARHAQNLNLKAGETLFKAGDDGSDLYIIKRGAVEICGNTLQAGASFGEIALFGETNRTADVVATQQTELISLDRDTILTTCKNSPEISIKLLRAMARIAARESCRKNG